MINATQFYEAFERHDHLLLHEGFKRKTKGKYISPNGIAIQTILNKWGWTEDVGWDFFIRMTDALYTPQGSYKPASDIRPSTLVQSGILSQKDFSAIYREHPQVYEHGENDSFAFFDIAQLNAVLELILPAVATKAKEWSVWREDQRQLPPRPKRTPQETEALRAASLKQLRDAGFKLERPK